MAHATAAEKPFAVGAHPRTCTISVRTELIQKNAILVSRFTAAFFRLRRVRSLHPQGPAGMACGRYNSSALLCDCELL
jgi:hypothetical protein